MEDPDNLQECYCYYNYLKIKHKNTYTYNTKYPKIQLSHTIISVFQLQ